MTFWKVSRPMASPSGDERYAERLAGVRLRQMIAGDIGLALHRRMAESPPYRPAVVGRKGRRLTGGRQPLRYAAHLPGVGIQNIQFTGDRRGDIRRKPLRHLNHILNGFTALQPLSHTRQQLADRPVGVALLLQPLTGRGRSREKCGSPEPCHQSHPHRVKCGVSTA